MVNNGLFDLLSTDMYVSYNVKLAHVLDLTSAIYISELININRKAIEKDKLREGGFFKLNRDYIETRTTLKKEEQKEIDSRLKSIKLIDIGESSDLLKINMDILTSIMLGEEELVTTVVQPAKRGRPSKQEIVIRALKGNIETTNSELKQAYEDWIDAVCAKNGWMAKVHVFEGQKVLNDYNKEKDLDVALEILKIAAMGGYRDISWAINEYKKKHPYNSSLGIIPNSPPVFSNVMRKSKNTINKEEVF